MEKLTYIVHKKSMVDTTYTYRLCLEIVRKNVLLEVSTALGLVVPRTATKADMVEQIDTYVRSHPKEVLSLLGVKELELVKEFIKAGPNAHVVKAPRKTLDTIKSLLFISVYYDKKTRKENLLMADELRELFAPHVKAVLKETKKKEKEREALRNHIDEYDEYDDIDELDEFDEFDELDDFEEFDEEWEEDDIDDVVDLYSDEEINRKRAPHLESKYSSAYDLVDDVRKLYYTNKPKVFKLFYKLLKADEYWSHAIFSRRFFESFMHIHYVHDEICTDDGSIEWLHYAENDFDNAISAIDYSDPMTFFTIAEQLYLLMQTMKEEQKK